MLLRGSAAHAAVAEEDNKVSAFEHLETGNGGARPLNGELNDACILTRER